MARVITRALLTSACLIILAACDGASTAVRPDPARLGNAVLAGSELGDWSAPENLGSTINSPFVDNLPQLSRDELSLYFTSNRPGGSGALDLWVSRRASTVDPWGTPENLGGTVNSGFNDAAPNLSRDGHYLFFTSNRPGGQGDNDLWVSWRADPRDDFGWEPPVNMGPVLNSAIFDAGAALRVPELYFTRGTTSTTLDIYLSRISGDEPGTPELVEELSSPANEQRPTLRFDRREILFASTRGGGAGLDDIWTSWRAGPGARWNVPTNVAALNTVFVDTQASLSEDGTTIIISSNRPGGSGGLDLWQSTRRR